MHTGCDDRRGECQKTLRRDDVSPKKQGINNKEGGREEDRPGETSQFGQVI